MTVSGIDPRVLALPSLHVVALTAVLAEDDAWDVVQETVLAVLQRPREFRSHPCLCDLVRFLAHKAAATQVKATALQDLSRPPAVDNDPAKLAQEHEGQQLLLTAIQQLPSHLQLAVREKHLRGRPVSEIASQLGITPRSIRYRLLEARGILRCRIGHDRS